MATPIPNRSANTWNTIISLINIGWLKPDHGSDENHPVADIRINSSLTKIIWHSHSIAILDHPLPVWQDALAANEKERIHAKFS
jgi:hypothetical protein